MIMAIAVALVIMIIVVIVVVVVVVNGGSHVISYHWFSVNITLNILVHRSA